MIRIYFLSIIILSVTKKKILTWRSKHYTVGLYYVSMFGNEYTVLS